MSRTGLSQFVRSSALVTAFAMATAAVAFAQAPKADNTKVNTRDRQKGAVTADQQKEDVTDRNATQKIRQALMRDKSLSTYARNVKVIATGGTVTLKGPVRTEAEKHSVESKAIDVVGADHVVNELSVVPATAKSK